MGGIYYFNSQISRSISIPEFFFSNFKDNFRSLDPVKKTKMSSSQSSEFQSKRQQFRNEIRRGELDDYRRRKR